MIYRAEFLLKTEMKFKSVKYLWGYDPKLHIA